jgi:hypothetical protein
LKDPFLKVRSFSNSTMDTLYHQDRARRERGMFFGMEFTMN